MWLWTCQNVEQMCLLSPSLAGGCKAHVCWELHNNYFPFFHSLLVKWSEILFLLETWLYWLAVGPMDWLLGSLPLQWDAHSRSWIMIRWYIYFRSADLGGLDSALSSCCSLIWFESKWMLFQMWLCWCWRLLPVPRIKWPFRLHMDTPAKAWLAIDWTWHLPSSNSHVCKLCFMFL